MRRNPSPIIQKVFLHRREISIQVITAKHVHRAIQVLADQFSTTPHVIQEAVEVFCRGRNYPASHKAEGNLAKVRQNKAGFLTSQEIKRGSE